MNSMNATSPSGAEFSVRNVLSAIFFLLRKNLLTYIIISCIFVSLTALTVVIFFPDFIPILGSLGTLSNEEAQKAMSDIAMQSFYVALVRYILFAIGAGMTSYGVMQGFRGRAFSLREALSAVLPQLSSLILISIACLLFIVLGMMLVIPGLFLFIFLTPVVTVCTIEKKSVVSSIVRTCQLMSNVRNFFIIFTVFLILFLSSFFLAIILASIFANMTIIANSIFIILSILYVTLYHIACTVIYFYIRSQQEGKNADAVAQEFGWA